MYLIDQSLTAYSTADLLKKRGQIFKHKYHRPQSGDLPDQAGRPADVAVSPNGKLLPGQLYPSANEPTSLRYYLPRYRLNVVDGQFTTSLKWRSADESSSGALAWLTIDLAPQLPSAPRLFRLQEIDHEAAVRISYHMPVKNDSARGSDIDSWVGTWVNVDAATRGMTRLKIIKTSDQKITLQGFGKCHPRDCDWGVTSATLQRGRLGALYDVGWKKTNIIVTQANDQLIADVFSDYSEEDGRTDRRNRYVLKRETPVNPGPQLWFEVGALKRLPSGIRQVRRAITSKAEFDRLYQIMTDQRFNAQLEIQCLATIGHRSWQQVMLDKISPSTQINVLKKNQVLLTDIVDFKVLKPLQATVQQQSIRQFRPSAVSQTQRLPETLQRQMSPHARIRSPQVRLNPLPDRQGQSSGSVQSVQTPATSASLNLTAAQIARQPQISRVFAQPLEKTFQNSDLTVMVNGQQHPAIPTKAVISVQGQPAILRVPTEAKQTLPFFFSPDTHSYMFDRPAGGPPAGETVLIKRSVHSQEGAVIGTFWQDSGIPDQFYYEPEEFRLARRSQPASDAPYQPDLVIALYEAVLQTEDESTTISYRAELAYQAQPYINPQVLERAREQLADPGTAAKFTALSPLTSQLILQLPLDQNDGRLQSVERPEVEVSFDDGIIDEVSLSSSELERILAAFQTPSGVGLSGHVKAQLLDGKMAQIPVNLSLVETASPLFDTTFHGPVPDAAGRYRLSLRNRIESPVHIDGIGAIALSPETTAYPQTSPGIQVEPGDSIALDYQITPADAKVQTFEPVLTTRIQVQTSDPELWSKFIVNQGYTAETFRVSVAIAPVYFETTPPGMAPLTGVHVEFDSGAAITLTPEALSQDVELRIPLLPRLMNDINAKQYYYQITNLHGEEIGAETDWSFSDQGELPLVIEPAR
ncbi:MAG: hypothetical protein AAGF01_09880 [Cyanobacteria bacterium P01_G01_bin.38]